MVIESFGMAGGTCAQCQKSFAEDNALLSHISLRHFGWIPYQCSYCETHFASIDEVHSHLAKKHRGKPKRYLYQEDEEKRLSITRAWKSSLQAGKRTLPGTTSREIPMPAIDPLVPYRTAEQLERNLSPIQMDPIPPPVINRRHETGSRRKTLGRRNNEDAWNESIELLDGRGNDPPESNKEDDNVSVDTSDQLLGTIFEAAMAATAEAETEEQRRNDGNGPNATLGLEVQLADVCSGGDGDDHAVRHRVWPSADDEQKPGDGTHDDAEMATEEETATVEQMNNSATETAAILNDAEYIAGLLAKESEAERITTRSRSSGAGLSKRRSGSGQPLRCQKCNTTVDKRSSVRGHLINRHMERTSGQCPTCAFHSADWSLVVRHVTQFHSENNVRKEKLNENRRLYESELIRLERQLFPSLTAEAEDASGNRTNLRSRRSSARLQQVETAAAKESSTKDRLKCSDCWHPISRTVIAAEQHAIRCHMAGSTTQCAYCTYRRSSAIAVKNHVNAAHPNQPIKFSTTRDDLHKLTLDKLKVKLFPSLFVEDAELTIDLTDKRKRRATMW